MTTKFRDRFMIAFAFIAIVGQSGLAAGQQLDQARFQAYGAVSSAATSHVVAKGGYISYTVEPADDLCTIVLRNATYASGRIRVGEVTLPFRGSTWSTAIWSDNKRRGIAVRSAEPGGVTVRHREYTLGEDDPVVHAPSHVASTVVFPVRQSDEAVLALKTALDHIIAICK